MKVIFRIRPTRRNIRILKRFGHIKVQTDWDQINLQLQIRPNEKKAIEEDIIKLLERYGYYTYDVDKILLSRASKVSYLKEPIIKGK